jgi:peroxiredoxin family protein
MADKTTIIVFSEDLDKAIRFITPTGLRSWAVR